MLQDVITQCNWVDLFVIIALFRISYIAMRNGLSAELFKFLGIILAIYLSAHYYISLSDWIRSHLPFSSVMRRDTQLEFLDFLIFSLLVTIGYLIFVLLRHAFHRFIKMEAVPRLSKWSGLVLGVVRGILTVSLILFMFVISSISYFRNSAINSYSGSRLFKISPAVYSVIWHKFMSKFMPQEKFNDTVLDLQKSFQE